MTHLEKAAVRYVVARENVAARSIDVQRHNIAVVDAARESFFRACVAAGQFGMTSLEHAAIAYALRPCRDRWEQLSRAVKASLADSTSVGLIEDRFEDVRPLPSRAAKSKRSR